MNKKDDRIIDITSDVKWVGILDYDIRTFDIVMTTDYGTTYNSYFINAENKALIEVAKEKFFDIYIQKVQKLTDPAEIKYIILDHTEPDHSGSLRRLLKMAPSATVVGSGNAIRYLEDIMNIPFKSLVVRDGDTLDLGGKTLKFISAPNLHWPDTIYTYLEEDKIMFTCDSFGAHYCREEMSDEMNEDYLKALKYYFDVILKPFSRFMIKAIERIKTFDIRYVCPGHGPLLMKNHKEVVALTKKWSEEYLVVSGTEAKRCLLIAYVSAYGFTKRAAEVIAAEVQGAGEFKVKLVDIEHSDINELDSLVTSADALLVGSPTINQNTLLPVYKLFAIINPLRDKGKLAGAFGSYGWSGEGPRIINEVLRNLKLKIFDEPALFKFSPEESKEDLLRDFARRFAARFEEECGPKEKAD